MKLLNTFTHVIDDQTEYVRKVDHTMRPDRDDGATTWYAESDGSLVQLSGPVCGTLEELFSDAVPAGGLTL